MDEEPEVTLSNALRKLIQKRFAEKVAAKTEEKIRNEPENENETEEKFTNKDSEKFTQKPEPLLGMCIYKKIVATRLIKFSLHTFFCAKGLQKRRLNLFTEIKVKVLQ